MKLHAHSHVDSVIGAAVLLILTLPCQAQSNSNTYTYTYVCQGVTYTCQGQAATVPNSNTNVSPQTVHTTCDTAKVYIKATTTDDSNQTGSPAIYYAPSNQQASGSNVFQLPAPPATAQAVYVAYLNPQFPVVFNGENAPNPSNPPPIVSRVQYELHAIGTAWDTTDYLLDTKSVGAFPRVAVQIYTSNPSQNYVGDPYINSSYLNYGFINSPEGPQEADPELYQAFQNANVSLTQGVPATIDDTAASTNSNPSPFALLTGLDPASNRLRDTTYVRRTRADFPYWVSVSYVAGELQPGDQLWLQRTGLNYNTTTYAPSGQSYPINIGGSSSVRLDSNSTVNSTTGIATWPASGTPGVQASPSLTGFSNSLQQTGAETWTVTLVTAGGAVVSLASPTMQVWPAQPTITYVGLPSSSDGTIYSHLPPFTISVTQMYPNSQVSFDLQQNGTSLGNGLTGAGQQYGSYSPSNAGVPMTTANMPIVPQSTSAYIQNLEPLIPATADNGNYTIQVNYQTPQSVPSGTTTNSPTNYQFVHTHIIRVSGQLSAQ